MKIEKNKINPITLLFLFLITAYFLIVLLKFYLGDKIESKHIPIHISLLVLKNFLIPLVLFFLFRRLYLNFFGRKIILDIFDDKLIVVKKFQSFTIKLDDIELFEIKIPREKTNNTTFKDYRFIELYDNISNIQNELFGLKNGVHFRIVTKDKIYKEGNISIKYLKNLSNLKNEIFEITGKQL